VRLKREEWGDPETEDAEEVIINALDAFSQARCAEENRCFRNLAIAGALVENGRVSTRRKFLLSLGAALLGTWAARAERQPPDPEDRLDLNTATPAQLMKLPGMTQVWAARIVRFRPYLRKDDLVNRGVVTGEVYARIADWVVAHRAKR